MSDARTVGDRLDADQKQFIIGRLAEFCGLRETSRLFKTRFGFTPSLQSIHHYSHSPKWSAEIDKLRDVLREQIATLPIASKFWRLKKLQALFDQESRYRTVRLIRTGGSNDAPRFTRIREIPLKEIRELLRQAAEELGELRQVHEHRGIGNERTCHFEDGEPYAAVASTVSTEVTH